VSSSITDSIIVSNLFARFSLGTSLLLTAALNEQFYIALLQLIIAISLLTALASGLLLLRRSILLLCWLVTPILLLHALFTPGELLVKGMNIPISVEGVQMGAWFAFHLVVIFLSALVFSRLLGKQEWIRLLINIPMIGGWILPYALLFESGLKKNRGIVNREYAKWNSSDRKIKQLPDHIINSLTDMLGRNLDDTDELWHNWDQRVSSITNNRLDNTGDNLMVSVMLAMAAIFVWVLYLAGRG